VFVYTLSGWVEAFPTWTEKAREVVRCLLKEIIPRFGIPVSIGLDNGPAFVAEVVQLMAKGLGITWELHMAYCPQCSGKVEYMNRTLKLQLGKLCQETHLQWDQLLPIALLRTRSSPTKQMGLSPFEVLYGRPSPLISGIRGDLKEIGDFTLRQQMQALRLTLSKINDWVWERLPLSLTTLTHPYRPGDAVWVKE
jgi:transposase InsO family protein